MYKLSWKEFDKELARKSKPAEYAVQRYLDALGFTTINLNDDALERYKIYVEEIKAKNEEPEKFKGYFDIDIKAVKGDLVIFVEVEMRTKWVENKLHPFGYEILFRRKECYIGNKNNYYFVVSADCKKTRIANLYELSKKYVNKEHLVKFTNSDEDPDYYYGPIPFEEFIKRKLDGLVLDSYTKNIVR